MSIKNRLEKLERSRGVKSDFCNCSVASTEIVVLDKESSLPPTGETLPVCDKCGLNIVRETIIIQFV